MEHKKVKLMLQIIDRVAKYILDWEERRGKDLIKVKSKIEKKGSSVFTRKEKIIISEMTYEFGQQAVKILGYLNILNDEFGKVKIDKKYRNLRSYLLSHKFNPPIDFEIK